MNLSDQGHRDEKQQQQQQKEGASRRGGEMPVACAEWFEKQQE